MRIQKNVKADCVNTVVLAYLNLPTFSMILNIHQWNFADNLPYSTFLAQSGNSIITTA